MHAVSSPGRRRGAQAALPGPTPCRMRRLTGRVSRPTASANATAADARVRGLRRPHTHAAANSGPTIRAHSTIAGAMPSRDPRVTAASPSPGPRAARS